MRKIDPCLLIIFLSCLSMSTILYGDDFFTVKKRIVENSWKQLAFFYITPSITLSDVGYNSNIYLYDNRRTPDWTADLGIRLQVSTIAGRRFILSIEENPYYSFYAENVGQRSINNVLRATLFTYLGRMNLKYQFSHAYEKKRPTSEFGPITRMRQQEQLLSLDYGRHTLLFVTLYASLAEIGHDEENYLGSYNLRQSLDRQELKAGISLNKIIFSRTRLSLNYDYIEYTFDYRIDKNGIGSQVSLGIEFPEIGRITGSFYFGFRIFRPKNTLYRDYTKPFGSGKVTLSLLKRLKLHLRYLVDNFYSFWQDEQQYNEKSAQAEIEYYLTRGIKLGYSLQIGKLSYENLSDGGQTRADDMRSSRFFVGLRLFKKFGIGLEYRIYRADSSAADFNRSADFIGGYFIHEF